MLQGSHSLEDPMNAFFEHHKDNIRFDYRCFDRILLHAAIQPFQQEQRAVGFFWTDRKSTRLNSSHRTISYAVFCLKKKIEVIVRVDESQQDERSCENDYHV